MQANEKTQNSKTLMCKKSFSQFLLNNWVYYMHKRAYLNGNLHDLTGSRTFNLGPIMSSQEFRRFVQYHKVGE